jgi:MFS family permease
MAHPDRRDSGSPSARWPLAVGLSIAQIISWGSIFYGFSVLLGPIEQEMHWGRDAIVGAFSLSVLVTGLGAAPVGVMLDRYGGRRVMALGSIGAALIFLLMSQVQSIAAFYVAWAALGCAAAMLLYEPAFAVIYEVYGANARNALTALTLMAGFASTIFWPLTNTLVGVLGWRNTLVALGAMNFLVCFPLHALAISPVKRNHRRPFRYRRTTRKKSYDCARSGCWPCPSSPISLHLHVYRFI